MTCACWSIELAIVAHMDTLLQKDKSCASDSQLHHRKESMVCLESPLYVPL